MKKCATCGRPHPDDVSTSHHPEGCTCGLSLCGGLGPNGCIWLKTVTLPAGLPPSATRRFVSDLQRELELENLVWSLGLGGER